MDRALKVEVERVKRRDRDLNPLQEAEIICKAFPIGTPVKKIMRSLKRSFPWVRTRLGLMEMPAEVQQFMVSGLLSQNDLAALLHLPRSEQLDAARRVAAGDREPIDSFAKHVRGRSKKQRAEINRMIERLFDLGIDGLPTRLLAWATGSVSDETIENEILEFSHNHSADFAVEVADDNSHQQPTSSTTEQPGSESGCDGGGDGADCPDDAGDLSPAGD